LVRIATIHRLLTAVALIALLVAPELFTYRSVADPVLVAGSYLFDSVRLADGLGHLSGWAER